eukprot:gnl/Chilomastix_cuspidata/5606.p1 GENE.gnl/Chilomastix_cuspidata/5606~~gnl/Chilomastix_cuspidata/5606.p1  ORF type:complete len:3321 (-),score=434.69 gnl/Chilomastix_cuspidata/5606:44-9565(-)
MLQSIVSNIEVNISNIHVRIEKTGGSTPFAAGLTIDKLTAVTCDNTWSQIPISDARSPFFWKLATLEDMSVYLDTEFRSFADLPEVSLIKEMREGVGTDSGDVSAHRYILRPFSTQTRFQIARNYDKLIAKVEKKSRHSSHKKKVPSKILLETDIPKLSLEMSSRQIECLREQPLQLIGFGNLQPPRSCVRPAERPMADPVGWWAYALAAIREKVFDREYRSKISFCAQQEITRSTYVDLVQRADRKETKLSEQDEQNKLEIEQALAVETLTHYRMLARAEITFYQERVEKQNATLLSKLPFFKAKPSAPAGNSFLTGLERLEFFMSLNDQASIKDILKKPPLPPHASNFEIRLGLNMLRLTLVADSAAPDSKMLPNADVAAGKLLGARFASLPVALLSISAISLNFRNGSDTATLSLGIGDLVGRNFSSNCKYPVFLRKLANEADLLSSDEHLLAVSPKVRKKSRPLISLNIALPRGRKATKVSVDFQRLQVIITPSLFEIFRKFTAIHETPVHETKISTPLLRKPPLYSKLREMTQNELRHQVTTKSQTILKVKFRSPLVLFPNPEESSFLMVDLGALSVSSKSKEFPDVPPTDPKLSETHPLTASNPEPFFYTPSSILVRNIRIFFSDNEDDLRKIVRMVLDPYETVNIDYNYKIMVLHALDVNLEKFLFSDVAGYVSTKLDISVPQEYSTAIEATLTSKNISPVKNIIKAFARSAKTLSKSSRKTQQQTVKTKKEKRLIQMLNGIEFPVTSGLALEHISLQLSMSLPKILIRMAWEEHFVYSNLPLLVILADNLTFHIQHGPLLNEIKVLFEDFTIHDLTAPGKEQRLLAINGFDRAEVKIKNVKCGHEQFPYNKIFTKRALEQGLLSELSPGFTDIIVSTREMSAIFIRSSIETINEFVKEIRGKNETMATGAQHSTQASKESEFFHKVDTLMRFQNGELIKREQKNYSACDFQPFRLRVIVPKLSAMFYLRIPIFHVALEELTVLVQVGGQRKSVSVLSNGGVIYDMETNTVHREVLKFEPTETLQTTKRSNIPKQYALRVNINLLPPSCRDFQGKNIDVYVKNNGVVFHTFTIRAIVRIVELIFPVEENMIKLQRKLDAKLPEYRGDLNHWFDYISNRLKPGIIGLTLDLNEVSVKMPTHDTRMRGIVLHVKESKTILYYKIRRVKKYFEGVSKEDAHKFLLSSKNTNKEHPVVELSSEEFPFMKFCPWMCVHVSVNGVTAMTPNLHEDNTMNTLFRGETVAVDFDIPVLLPRTVQMLATGLVPEKRLRIAFRNESTTRISLSPAQYDMFIGMFIINGIFQFKSELFEDAITRKLVDVEREILSRNIVSKEYFIPSGREYRRLPYSKRNVVDIVIKFNSVAISLVGHKGPTPPPEKINTDPFAAIKFKNLNVRLALRENLDKDFYIEAMHCLIFDNIHPADVSDVPIGKFIGSKAQNGLSVHAKLFGTGGMAVCVNGHRSAICLKPAFFSTLGGFWMLPDFSDVVHVVPLESPRAPDTLLTEQEFSQCLVLSQESENLSDILDSSSGKEPSLNQFLESSDDFTVQTSRDDPFASIERETVLPLWLSVNLPFLSLCFAHTVEDALAVHLGLKCDYVVHNGFFMPQRDGNVNIENLRLFRQADIDSKGAPLSMNKLSLNMEYHFPSDEQKTLLIKEVSNLRCEMENLTQDNPAIQRLLRKSISINCDGGEIIFSEPDVEALMVLLSSFSKKTAGSDESQEDLSQEPPVLSTSETTPQSQPAQSSIPLYITFFSKSPLIVTLKDSVSSLFSVWLSKINANVVLGAGVSTVVSCTPSIWNYSERVGTKEPLLAPFNMVVSFSKRGPEFLKLFAVVDRKTPVTFFVTPQIFQNIFRTQRMFASSMGKNSQTQENSSNEESSDKASKTNDKILHPSQFHSELSAKTDSYSGHYGPEVPGTVFVNQTGFLILVRSFYLPEATEVPSKPIFLDRTTAGVFIPLRPFGRKAQYSVEITSQQSILFEKFDIDVSKPFTRLISVGRGISLRCLTRIEESRRIVTFSGKTVINNQLSMPIALSLQLDEIPGTVPSSALILEPQQYFSLPISSQPSQSFSVKGMGTAPTRYSRPINVTTEEKFSLFTCHTSDEGISNSLILLDSISKQGDVLIHTISPPVIFSNDNLCELEVEFLRISDGGLQTEQKGILSQLSVRLCNRTFPPSSTTPIITLSPDMLGLTVCAVVQGRMMRSNPLLLSKECKWLPLYDVTDMAHPEFTMGIRCKRNKIGTFEIRLFPLYTFRNSVPLPGTDYSPVGTNELILDANMVDGTFGKNLRTHYSASLRFNEIVQFGPITRKPGQIGEAKLAPPFLALSYSGNNNRREQTVGVNLKNEAMTSVILLPAAHRVHCVRNGFDELRIGFHLQQATEKPNTLFPVIPLSIAVTSTNSGLTKHFEILPRFAIANNLPFEISVSICEFVPFPQPMRTLAHFDVQTMCRVSLPPIHTKSKDKTFLPNIRCFFGQSQNLLDQSQNPYDSVCYSCGLAFDADTVNHFTLPLSTGNFFNITALVKEVGGMLILLLAEAEAARAPVRVTNMYPHPIQIQQSQMQVRTLVKQQIYNEMHLVHITKQLELSVPPRRLQTIRLNSKESVDFFADDPTIPVWLNARLGKNYNAFVPTSKYQTYKNFTHGFECEVKVSDSTCNVAFGTTGDEVLYPVTEGLSESGSETVSKDTSEISVMLRVDISQFSVRLFDSSPCELARFTLEHLSAGVDLGGPYVNAGVKIGNLQLDDMSPKSKYRVVLTRDPSVDTSLSFFRAKFKKTSETNVKEVMVHLLPLRLCLEDSFLFNILGFVKELKLGITIETGFLQGAAPTQTPLPLFLDEASPNERRPASLSSKDLGSGVVFIDSAAVEATRINLNFSFSEILSAVHLGPLAGLVNSISSLIGNVQDATVYLPPFRLQNWMGDVHTLSSNLRSLYIASLKHQILSVLSATTITGSLTTVQSHVTEGVSNFFIDSLTSADNFLDFGERFSQNLVDLAKHSVAAGAGLVSSVTGSVARAFFALSANDVAKEKRERALRHSRRSFRTAVEEAVNSVGRGVKYGVLGVYYEPRMGLRRSGRNGLIAGLGKGVVGLLALPIGGAVDVATHLAIGVQQRVAAEDHVRRLFKVERFAPGAVISSREALRYLEKHDREELDQSDASTSTRQSTQVTSHGARSDV